MKYAVNQPVPKLDSAAMTTGKPIYTEDLAPADCLIVKVLRSPHAFARITAIRKKRALAVPGVACALTWEDVPRIRHSLGGLAYTFGSPNDRYILEDTVRYVGDAVAIVAAETEEAADKALRLLEVDYELLPAVLDPRQALDHQPPIHGEEDYSAEDTLQGQPKRNLMAHFELPYGDLDAAFAKCDVVVEDTFHTRANSHAMMETFRAFSYYDANGRLAIVTSTQIPFLCRRTAAQALGMPIDRIRVIKPKVGGGFGAKQSLVCELLCAIVTVKTRRPAKLIYSRTESFIASNSRHETYITVKLGATKDGIVRAASVHTISNAGAYGEQAFATALLTGVKTLPMFGRAEAFHFDFDITYTNTMAGGAFRGFGATQGFFATESMTNRLAVELGMDPCQLRLKNIPHSGDFMPAYFFEFLTSSALDRCIKTGRNMIGWDQKYPRVEVDGSRVRAVGMAVALQSSGISKADKCCTSVKLCEDGRYIVSNGAGDMGTGCDTVLAQIAAETLQCSIDRVSSAPVDTDSSPYDKGSFASSTTYVTGMAMVKACEQLTGMMKAEAARALDCPVAFIEFDGDFFYARNGSSGRLSLELLARRQVTEPDCPWFTAEGSHCSPTSPPPLMAGFAEIELDKDTGKVTVLDYVGVVDCGTVVNPALARVQAQGGIAQGIGMALYEDVQYDEAGRMLNRNFLRYKIPSRMDLPPIRVAFEQSYEPSGPFGAKSIGEVVINTPVPAIADAIYNACGVRMTDLPMTPEKILKGLRQQVQP